MQQTGKTYKADATTQLGRIVEPGSVKAVVTSTAYWGKRNYAADYDAAPSDSEMGKGSLSAFLDEQVALGLQVWDALSDTGTYWLNLGDTSSGSGGAGGDHGAKGSKGAHTGAGGIAKYKQGKSGLAPGQQCLVPERVAIALQDSGWIVKKTITWDKGGIKPEDPRHVRRPRFASETILMLVKDVKRYTYNHEAEVEPGDVWHFPPHRGRRRTGPAPFPEELPRRCILLSTNPGDLVLDPCMGSGTTGRVAEGLGRPWIGVDLYKGVKPRRSAT